jgi:hypothetical protein
MNNEMLLTNIENRGTKDGLLIDALKSYIHQEAVLVSLWAN